MENKGEIIFYNPKKGKSLLEVRLENETIWLTQNQMASLFSHTKQNVSLHISNIFKEKELNPKAVVKKSLTTALDGKKYNTTYYNLDVIISVGYRVKSKQGTQFRIWATKTLKDHLVKGFTINEKKLKEQQDKLTELYETISFIEHSINKKEITSDEAKGLLQIISQYTRSFVLLNKFDSNNLETNELNKDLLYEIKYDEAVKAITLLKKDLIIKKEASELFGKQRAEGFKNILQSVIQTFDGRLLYPSVEEQAAHLLYFLIKNHPFADGNKRIGAFLFVWFLERNKHLLTKKGKLKINDNALVALALLIAQSNPDYKEIMIKLTINLVNE